MHMNSVLYYDASAFKVRVHVQFLSAYLQCVSHFYYFETHMSKILHPDAYSIKVNLYVQFCKAYSQMYCLKTYMTTMLFLMLKLLKYIYTTNFPVHFMIFLTLLLLAHYSNFLLQCLSF
jgi:hypothetical protein